jgi:hypothetical protein
MIREVVTSVVDALAAAGLDVTDDPAKFDPRPVGVLVGIPELGETTLGAYQVTVPVHVVSGEPLTPAMRDVLFMDALAAAQAIGSPSFQLTGWDGNVNATPLPAYRMTTTVLHSTD